MVELKLTAILAVLIELFISIVLFFNNCNIITLIICISVIIVTIILFNIIIMLYKDQLDQDNHDSLKTIAKNSDK